MANIYSFSLPDKDKHLMEKINELSDQFDCSNTVMIKRALKSDDILEASVVLPAPILPSIEINL